MRNFVLPLIVILALVRPCPLPAAIENIPSEILSQMPSSVSRLVLDSPLPSLRSGTDIRNSLCSYGCLKSLIGTSLWALHLSQTLKDQDSADAAEQVYTASLDENERRSGRIAASIVAKLKDGNDSAFRLFTDFFASSGPNTRSGLFNLASAIEEQLLNARKKNLDVYLRKIREIKAQAQSAQVSLEGFETMLTEMIQRFGILVASEHGAAVDELITTGDKDEFAASMKYIDLAFDLYAKLNNQFCTTCTRETAKEIYDKARTAQSNGRYEEAITLFRKVIAMDPAYASQNGCYWHIGKCYREWKKYNEAESAFKDSIRHDQTKPYKRQAF
ncbi:MAG: hypothetical protein PHQ23_10885, partial [Candidatus Wallbacteria bacterium]|nr:hypothetical protein [Candidatus Wallbacteria bacterium]